GRIGLTHHVVDGAERVRRQPRTDDERCPERAGQIIDVAPNALRTRVVVELRAVVAEHHAHAAPFVEAADALDLTNPELRTERHTKIRAVRQTEHRTDERERIAPGERPVEQALGLEHLTRTRGIRWGLVATDT